MTAPDLLGPREVAALLGVQHQTVHQWRYRGRLPDPDLTVSGVPMWRREVIEAWAASRPRRGRPRRQEQ